jgi:predicted aldo/keto reductase-like oxidoreductase
VDTAYGYHGGKSEIVVGKALQDGYRDKVKVATKLPCWHVKETADFDRLLDEQRGKLQVECVDCYLIHSLNANFWPKMCELGLLEWIPKAKADGRITHIGFSFHDKCEVFKEIVDGYDGWEFCQIQYNYMNETEQAGTEGLAYAAERGLAVVIMEPILGGLLAHPPEAVQAVWDAAPQGWSPAEWALQWLWNKPQVSTVLSGMSTMDQTVENVAAAARSGLGALDKADLARVARAAEAYESLRPVPCTQCRYCMPCPHELDIPRNMALFMDGHIFGERRMRQSQRQYRKMDEKARAQSCVQCRECEEKCPQDIEISQVMPRIAAELGE